MNIGPFVAAPTDLPPRKAAARAGRKIALCGSHSPSLVDAPWDDPTWEFWGHASSRAWYRHQLDRYFDLHPKACWTRGGRKGPEYPKWLAKNTVPIFMQQKYAEVPASVAFPKRRILTEFSDARPYFTNQVAWMIAFAMTEGVSAIGLWGVDYGSEGEYVRQRGSAEYWLGRAAERGIRIVLPEQCTLLAEPALLYGYESHDEVTGLLKDDYKRREWEPAIRPLAPGETYERAKPPAHLLEEIAQEEKDHPRPSWALGPLPSRTDGECRRDA